MEDYRALRQRVIDASLLIQRKGLIRGTSGNISLRSEDGKVIAITPSSIEYEQLTWDMIPLIDAEGAVIHCDANKTVLDNHYKPSSEVLMHTAVMKARQDIEAVVHTHSKFSTLLSFMGQELPIMTIPMIAYFPTPAPIAPFELPGSAALAQAAVKGLGSNGNAVILEKHGLLTVGKTLDKALTCTEYIEEEGLSFEEAALYFSADKQTRRNGGLLVDENTDSRLSRDKIRDAMAIEVAKLKVGEISEPFMDNSSGSEEYKIIKIKAYHPQHKANLEDDWSNFEEMLRMQKQQEVFLKWIREKQESTYIHIDDAYKNMTFRYDGWIK